MFIDLERDSVIRVQALMELAANSVRQCSKAFSALLSLNRSLIISLVTSLASPTLGLCYAYATIAQQWPPRLCEMQGVGGFLFGRILSFIYMLSCNISVISSGFRSR